MIDIEPRFRAKGKWLYILIVMAVSLSLLFVSRRLPGFSEWYARHVFPIFPLSLGRLSSIAPFSLFEFALLGLAISLPLILIWKILSSVRRRRQWQEDSPRKAFSLRILHFGCLLCSLFLIFALTFGINFNRDRFAFASGLDGQEISAGELRQLYRLLLSDIQELSAGASSSGNSRKASGGPLSDAKEYAIIPGIFPPMDSAELHQAAKDSMEELSRSYHGLIHYYPEAKPVFFSALLSRFQIGGFYSFLTMEANYNKDMPEVNKPFTICHELAHLSGFAREDEANFVSYLACSQSDTLSFRYSGLTYALRYTLNALRSSIEAEEYRRLCEYLPDWVWQDLQTDRQFWSAYEGRTSEVFQNFNDFFLKANDQEDGTQSYARMLYLLLAYYRDNGRMTHFSADPEPVFPDIQVAADALYCPNAILADRETGTILFAKDSAVRAEPASVTKILTAITAIELIEDMDASVTMKTRDYTDLYRLNASLSGFEVGEAVSYRDLLYTLMLISGCDSAYALANNLCGSLPAFAEKMNAKVSELGLVNSHFVDPSGLTAPEHYTTAEDMVTILDYALQNPLFCELFEAKSYTIPPNNHRSEEREINSHFFSRLERDYDGGILENNSRILGGKTGFTNAAGLCLATLGEFDGREYIVVIFGGPGTNRTPQYNFMDAMTLFSALRSREFSRQAY